MTNFRYYYERNMIDHIILIFIFQMRDAVYKFIYTFIIPTHRLHH